MTTSVDSKTAIDYKCLLSVNQISGELAACMLVEVNPEYNIIQSSVGKHIRNEKANKLFDVIQSWNYLHTQCPFWFINEAMKNRINVPAALLKEVKDCFLNFLPSDREKNLKDYPYIADRLDLKLDAIKNIPSYLNEKHPDFA